MIVKVPFGFAAARAIIPSSTKTFMLLNCWPTLKLYLSEYPFYICLSYAVLQICYQLQANMCFATA